MILVYIEHSGDTVSKGGLVTIAAALEAKQAHGEDKVVGLLLGGSGVSAAAAFAAKTGLDEVVYVEDEALSTYLALPYADAIEKAVSEFSPKLIIGSATSVGKDVFPRVAQKLSAGQASDCIGFTSSGFRRPMYAGDIIAEVEVTTDIAVATIRNSAFDAATPGDSACGVRALSISVDNDGLQKFVSFDTTESERPELSEADVVVSGGRALKSAENFDSIIAPLADKLGAAIGASRAAVDSGYAPNDWQVGQTGKIVAPKLYIAIGISGAIQHLAGMKDSKVIVAINTDPEAPIFEVADYGLVADLYEVVPELIEKLP